MSKSNEEKRVLIPEESGNDYTLPKEQWVWITVGSLTVYVKHQDEGVSVEVHATGKEDEDSITESWVLFSEAGE